MVITDEYSSGPQGMKPPNDPNNLSLGGGGSIVLAEDAVIVEPTEAQRADNAGASCCSTGKSEKNGVWPLSGCLPSKHSTRRTIPYYNILWAEVQSETLTINYLFSTSKDTLTPTTYTSIIPQSSIVLAEQWVTILLDRAYGTATKRKRIKVLINPFGGKGTASKIYNTSIAPIFAAARCSISVEHTTHAKHAEEIARDIEIEQWDVIACCSGDGIPHEVFNGLAQQKYPCKALRTVAVTQLPCGSGNAMSWNVFGTGSPSLAALGVVKGLEMPMDLVSITQGEKRTLSFLSQAVGIIAESDLGTDKWRWMGDTRFTVGYVLRLMRQTVWPVDVALGIEHATKEEVKRAYREYMENIAAESKLVASPRTSSSSTVENENVAMHDGKLPPLRFGTINDPLPQSWVMQPYPKLGNFYAGNMSYMSANSPVFPASVPADGLQDLMIVPGDIARKRALELADAVAKGELLDAKEVTYVKVVGYRIIPREKEGYISIDGERFPFEGFQAEVHKGLGCTLSKGGRIYESKGPRE